MKLTVLTDNNTYIDQYYLGEPGLSYFVEDAEDRVLFDTGYSDVFIRNAKALQVNLPGMTHLVFSHGHNDHTRGFAFLMRYMDLSRIKLIAHPDCFLPKRHYGLSVGAPLVEDSMDKLVRLELTTEPLPITANLFYLGEIPRAQSWEQNVAVGEVCREEAWEPDYMPDDSALAYKTERGIFIITGCSHSGICNIITRAREVCQDERILGIIGGMHLLQWDDRAEETVDFLYDVYQQSLAAGVQDFQFYPAHCTSLAVKAKMFAKGLPVQEVGVGLKLDF